MKCKYCHKEILDKEYGFRDFHSECRGKYRRAYLRFKALKIRNNEKMKDCIDTAKSRKVDKSPPTASRVYRPSKLENDESETFYDGFGGKAWYLLAKRACCNFDVRLRENYCVTLAEPLYRFTCKCSTCPLGKALMNKVKGKLKKAA